MARERGLTLVVSQTEPENVYPAQAPYIPPTGMDAQYDADNCLVSFNLSIATRRKTEAQTCFSGRAGIEL
jgi:hypothetical protein